MNGRWATSERPSLALGCADFTPYNFLLTSPSHVLISFSSDFAKMGNDKLQTNHTGPERKESRRTGKLIKCL